MDEDNNPKAAEDGQKLSPQDAASRESHIRDITKGARSALLWLASTTIIWQTISWALTIVTARILNPADYGLIALIETVTPYLGLVASFNIGTWMVQNKSMGEHEQKAMLSLSLVFGLLISIFAFCAAPFIADFYQRPEILLPFQLLALTFLVRSICVVPQAMLRRELTFKPIAIMNLSVGVTRGFLQLGLAFLGIGYWALVIGILFREFAITCWTLLVRPLPKGLRWDVSLFKSATKFGLVATGAAVFWIVFSTADDIVIGKLFAVEVLGLYTMAFFLTDMPMAKLNQVVQPVLMPYFSRLKPYKEDLHRAFLRSVRGLTGIIFPTLLGLCLVADEAVPVIFGDKWEGLVLPLQVMSFVGILRTFTLYVEPLMLALGKPNKVFAYNGLRAVILPPAFLALGYFFGMNGIYATWLILFPLTSHYILIVLRQVTGISPLTFVKNLRAPIIATALMGLIVFGFGSLCGEFLSPLSLLLAKFVVGVASYVAILWLVFRQETTEVIQVFRDA